jgi:hypothetical protein
VDAFLDRLCDALKSLEGRLIPTGWSAALVLALMLGGAALLTALVLWLV